MKISHSYQLSRQQSANLPTDISTLVDLITFQAHDTPGRVAFSFLMDDGRRQELTAYQLYARSVSIARELQRCAEPGDRALLVFPPGLEVIPAFFGCLLAGLLAVPCNYPKPRRPLPRHAAIAEDCQARIALTTGAALKLIDLQSESALSRMRWIASDEIDDSEDEKIRRFEATPIPMAFLQYTSGSTSEPRGVMLSHANLMHNLQVIHQSFDLDTLHATDANRISVLWLPAYHDMGLIGGILGSLYTRRHSVLISPASFLQRPIRWLQLMSEYRASISGGPNFAYELCVQKVKPAELNELDLSHWRLAFCGAEPIQAETLERFAKTFAPAGFRRDAFYPCYGLAENCLLVTGADVARGFESLTIQRAALAKNKVAIADSGNDVKQTVRAVACGPARCGQEVRIVDPDELLALPEDRIGEIWVRGPSVAQGYWNRPELTRESFSAQLRNGQEQTYLRTGDLGFLHGGQLYVAGRLKDLIIVRGQNLYPQDIEQTMGQCHAALRGHWGAAFPVDSDRGERLVLVQEVGRHLGGTKLKEILRAIRVAVSVEHEVEIYAVWLVRQASLPRTSSGKVQRQVCRRRIAEQSIPIVAKWELSGQIPTAQEHPPLSIDSGPVDSATLSRLTQEIQSVLLSWLKDRASIEPDRLGADAPFADMGVDSITAVDLSVALESWLGIELSPVAAWNYPTPSRLSAYLAERLVGQKSAQPETACSAESDFESLLAEIEAMPDSEVDDHLAKP